MWDKKKPDTPQPAAPEPKNPLTNKESAVAMRPLRDLLRKDTALARTELLKHSSEITMTPHRDSAQNFYVAEGNWDLLGNAWSEGASRLTGGFGWLRGLDLNQRPSGYENVRRTLGPLILCDLTWN
jgi:hypothetical protein